MKFGIYIGILKLALQETAKKRETINSIENYSEILEEIQKNQNMIKQWTVYKNKFNYASEIEFIDTCSTVRDILEEIF